MENITVTLNKLQEYYVPSDGNAVVELLRKHQEGATIVAGGTFIHGLIARGLITDVEALIDISRLGLNYVRTEQGQLRIGATTIFKQLGANEEVRTKPMFGAIRDALTYPPAQILNSATIGGCVSASCPFFDLPIAFLALDGMARAQGSGETRDIPLAEFFPSLFENALEPEEFMSELILPAMSGKSASAFIKLESNANDLAILNVAAWVGLDSAGKCEQARIFVGGGVGEVPARASTAEQALQGKELTAEQCAVAGQAAKSDVDPLSDHRASAEYRKAMTGILVERTLTKALSRLA